MPKQGWFGLFPVRSPLLRESLIVFYSSGYLDVSVLRVCDLSVTCLQHAGLPHSEIYTLKTLFASQCSLSQLITSFIAVVSQGIRQLLLITYERLNFLPICQRTFNSGEYRSRTDDLLRAKQAL